MHGRGKLIYKHEDHALWVESMVFGNPLGRWYKDCVRPLNGTFMGILGRFIWQLMNWWLSNQVCLLCPALLGVAKSGGWQKCTCIATISCACRLEPSSLLPAWLRAVEC